MICFVDYRTTDEETSKLQDLNFKVIKVPPDKRLYSSIDGHVDIQLNIIDKINKKIIINKNLPDSFKDTLLLNNISFIEAVSSLEYYYPNNIQLNAFITENFLVHNLKYTDSLLIDSCLNKKLINIKQGYTKCSILPLNEKAFITNDKGIYKALIKENFDILLLPPGDILLPGLDYGFIGGVGGMISENTMAFFGSLDHYLYGNEIKEFLNKYNINSLYLKDGKLIDRGSLFIL